MLSIGKAALIALFGMFPAVLFAQKPTLEEITYTGDNGTEKTVVGYFLGYAQEKYIVVGNTTERYVTTKLAHMTDWSNYEFHGREPTPNAMEKLIEWKGILDYGYRAYDNFGVDHHTGGNKALKIVSAPSGHSVPTWWGDDGFTLFVFSKLYVVGTPPPASAPER